MASFLFSVLLQGGSFAHSIVYYLRQYGVADVTQIYYNGTNATNNMAEANVWTNGPEAWAYWLEGKDLVIFEATEQQIRGGHKTDDMTWVQASGNGNLGHNAIYDSLYEYLKVEGRREVDEITWEKVGLKLRDLYERVIGW